MISYYSLFCANNRRQSPKFVMFLAPFMPLFLHKNPFTNDPFDKPITKGAGTKLMKVPNAIFDKDQSSSAI